MRFRSGALAVVAALLFASSSRADVTLLSFEPPSALVEIGASCAAADAGTVALAREADQTSAMLAVAPPDVGPELSLSESATSPGIDAVEAALAPERFIDLGEVQTMSLIADSLAEAGQTTTGSIRADLQATPTDDPGMVSLETDATSFDDAFGTPVLP